MEVRCGGCGAGLEVNPNLGGTRISCPGCGAAVLVPASPAPRPRRRPEPDAPRPAPREPYSAWLFAAQAALVALGAACLAGPFATGEWDPPRWSFFREDGLVLVVAGAAFLVAAGLARRLPILTTLLAAIAVLAACALHYRAEREVDASRALALSLAMLALWLALQHRRAVRSS